MEIIIDTETTGTGTGDQIIELAIINAATAEIIFNRRIRPSVTIDPEAARVHGIHDNFLIGCSPWPEFHNRVVDILTWADLILGYNLDFDVRLLRQTAEAFRCCFPVLKLNFRDLMVPYADIAKIEFSEKFGTWKWQKLEAACKQQGINLSDIKLHGALADCIATQRLYQKMQSDFVSYWAINL